MDSFVKKILTASDDATCVVSLELDGKWTPVVSMDDSSSIMDKRRAVSIKSKFIFKYLTKIIEEASLTTQLKRTSLSASEEDLSNSTTVHISGSQAINSMASKRAASMDAIRSCVKKGKLF